MARKPGKNSPKVYFTKETEEYIIKYNACTDQDEKNKIFTDHLYFPFYKLAENIIHTYKFYNTDTDQIEDLKLDIIRMLLTEKIAGFDPKKGAKAFSYFGTIVKRWLIAYSNENYLRNKSKTSIDIYENYLEDEARDFEAAARISLSNFMDTWIQDVSGRLTELFSKEQDIPVAEALLTVFKDRKNPEIVFRKKALYVYVRELTGSETPFITRVLRILREDFHQKFDPLVEEGLIDM